MERDANYAAVGAFVLLVALAAALFVYWYSDSREHRDYHRYEVYFEGSVSGLDRGAAVRYLGVGVAHRGSTCIDPRVPRGQVIVDVDSTTPDLLESMRTRSCSCRGDGTVRHRSHGGPRPQARQSGSRGLSTWSSNKRPRDACSSQPAGARSQCRRGGEAY
jgi:hypothetical protein